MAMLTTGLEQLDEGLRHPAATPRAVIAAEFDRLEDLVAAPPTHATVRRGRRWRAADIVEEFDWQQHTGVLPRPGGCHPRHGPQPSVRHWEVGDGARPIRAYAQRKIHYDTHHHQAKVLSTG
jgi:hypothetical protein